MGKGINYYGFRERLKLGRTLRSVSAKYGSVNASSAALKEAAAALEAAVEAKPREWVFWYALGDLYQPMGQFAESVRAAEKCVDLRPDDPRSLYALASNLRTLTHAKYVGQQSYIEARTKMHGQLATQGDAAPFDPARSQAALHELGMPLDLAAEWCLVLFERVLALGVRGEDKKHVEETLDVLYTEFPRLREVISLTRCASKLVTRGKALAARGLLDDAIRQFAEAVRLNPDLAEAHFNWGGALLVSRRDSEAIPRFREALRLGLESQEADAHVSLGTALRFEGQLDDAIVEFNKAIGLRPDFDEAHWGLAETYNDQGRLDRAIEEYRESIRLEPHSSGPRLGLGTALRRKGLLEEAIACYRDALRRDPGHALLHGSLAVALHQYGHLDEAIAEFREALRLAPEYAEAPGLCLLFGGALHQKGLFEEAIRAYEKVLREAPDDADVRRLLALATQGTPLRHDDIW